MESKDAPPLLLGVGVGKTYGEGQESVHALTDVSLELHGGRIVGLIGPNGAGKTTLLRLCAGLLSPTRGDLWVASHHTVKDAARARSSLGYLSASTGVYQRLTPVEMMRFFGRLHGMTEREIAERTDLLFAKLDIDEYRSRPCGQLSTGTKQKVSIARAFLHDPPVLILDEPTNGLDVVVRQNLLDMLLGAAGPERLIILSTHDLPEAEDLCDWFLFIDNGRIVAEGERWAILAGGATSLREAFFHALKAEGQEGPHAS